MAKHDSNDHKFDNLLNMQSPNLNPNWKTSTAKRPFLKRKFTSTLIQFIPVILIILGILYAVFK